MSWRNVTQSDLRGLENLGLLPESRRITLRNEFKRALWSNQAGLPSTVRG
jgi:hypothetical protein